MRSDRKKLTLRCQAPPLFRPRRRLYYALLAMVYFLNMPGAKIAGAQDNEDDPWTGIEEMLVIGSGAANLIDIGQGDSVLAFDADLLAALGAGDIADLAAFTPNLEIRSAGGGSQSTFFIRGVGLADFSANASGSIAIYQDDVPINAPAIQLSALFDVESVNVLRGPEGGTRHRNASAGVIKVYSKKPTGELGGYLKTTVGNYNLLQFEGALEVPIVPDLLTTRMAFQTTDRDGWTKNGCAGAPPNDQRIIQTVNPRVTGSFCGEAVRNNQRSDLPPGLPNNLNDEHNWAARMLVRFQPEIAGIPTDWLLNVHGAKRDQFSAVGQQIGFTGRIPDPITGVTTDTATSLQNRLGGSVNGYRDPDVVSLERALQERYPTSSFPRPRQGQKRNAKIFPLLANRLAKHLDKDPFRGDYNRVGMNRRENWGMSLKVDIPVDVDFEIKSITGFERYKRRNNTDTDYSPLTLFERVQEDDAWQATQEIEIRRTFDDVLTIEAGGLALREELDVHIDDLELQRLDPLEIDLPNINQTRDYSQKTWNVGVFARFEWMIEETFLVDAGIRYNWEKKNFVYSFIESRGDRSEFTSNTWDHFAYDFRLRYHPTEDIRFYAKFTHGWRSGHFNATANELKGVTAAKPEKLNSWEVGLTSDWLDGRLKIDGAAFFYRYEDYQVFVTNRDFSAVPEQVITNADDAQVYGIELDVVVQPVDELRLSLNFGWLESEFIDFIQQRLIQQQVSLAPPLSISTQLNEDFSGNRLQNSPKYSLSLSATYDFDLGELGTLTPGYYASWTDDVHFDISEGRGLINDSGQTFLPKNTIGQKALWLHNVRLEWKGLTSSIQLAGWIRNVTNQVYKVFAFETGQYAGALVGEPRTYGLDMTLQW